MALTVTVHPAATSGVDEMGDEIEIPGEPYELEVESIYPTASDEPGDPNRSLVITRLTILAPEGVRVGAHDELEVPGYEGRWGVVGEVAIFDERSNPARRRGVLGRGRRPGLDIGCVQINVEKVAG